MSQYFPVKDGLVLRYSRLSSGVVGTMKQHLPSLLTPILLCGGLVGLGRRVRLEEEERGVLGLRLGVE